MADEVRPAPAAARQRGEILAALIRATLRALVGPRERAIGRVQIGVSEAVVGSRVEGVPVPINELFDLEVVERGQGGVSGADADPRSCCPAPAAGSVTMAVAQTTATATPRVFIEAPFRPKEVMLMLDNRGDSLRYWRALGRYELPSLEPPPVARLHVHVVVVAAAEDAIRTITVADPQLKEKLLARGASWRGLDHVIDDEVECRLWPPRVPASQRRERLAAGRFAASAIGECAVGCEQARRTRDRCPRRCRPQRRIAKRDGGSRCSRQPSNRQSSPRA